MTSTGYRFQKNGIIGSFRPIYYLGCKAGFTSAIKKAIDDVDPSGGRLLDLFAGTGSVSAALATEREVTAVDIQEYSRVLCSAVLNPAALSQAAIADIVDRAMRNETTQQVLWCVEPLVAYEHQCINAAVMGDADALAELIESPPLVVSAACGVSTSSPSLGSAIQEVIRRLRGSGLWLSAETTVLRYFGGLYFSFTQAALLDAVLAVAVSYDEPYRNTLMAAALSTASQLVNTVGKQFAQPLQPRNKSGTVKSNLAKIVERDRSLDAMKIYQTWLGRYAVLPQGTGRPKAQREDYLNALVENAPSCSVIYADPPYTRDHYSRFYHVLETMCLRDNPEISTVVKKGNKVVSRGAYRAERHQSEFCIRSAAPVAFDSLFKTAREQDLPLVLSYSPHETGDGTHPRVVSMDQIIELARESYDRVELVFVEGVTHNKLNSSGLKLKTREHAEILLKCFR